MREKKFILWQYMYAYVCIVNYKNHTFSPREGYLTLDSKMIKTNKLLRLIKENVKGLARVISDKEKKIANLFLENYTPPAKVKASKTTQIASGKSKTFFFPFYLNNQPRRIASTLLMHTAYHSGSGSYGQLFRSFKLISIAKPSATGRSAEFVSVCLISCHFSRRIKLYLQLFSSTELRF